MVDGRPFGNHAGVLAIPESCIVKQAVKYQRMFRMNMFDVVQKITNYSTSKASSILPGISPLNA